MQFLQSLLPLFLIQFGILLDRLLDLIGRQVLIVAEALGFKVIGRNALGDQEVFGNLSTPFRKSLVVPVLPTLVSVTNERQVGVGLVLEIFLESVCDEGERRRAMRLDEAPASVGPSNELS